MTIYCPKCRTENSIQARYCKNCREPLTLMDAAAQRFVKQLDPGARIQNFQVLDLFFASDQVQKYTVLDLAPEDERVRKCTNLNCGAYHIPFGDTVEKVCTQCGNPLSTESLQLQMIRSQTEPGENVRAVIKRGITHGCLSIPLHTLVVSGEHYLISAPSKPMPEEMEQDNYLDECIGLANALEVLHKGGVTFNGQNTKRILVALNDHLAWSLLENTFSLDLVTPETIHRDTMALAQLIYKTLTRGEIYTPQAGLPKPMDELFRRTLAEQQVATPAAFREALEEALQQQMVSGALEFAVGRLSNVGMQRQLNEDSLLAMEMNLIRQSQGQPRGIFAVADGMGGHAAGEVASGQIVQTLMEKANKELFADWAVGSPINYQKWISGAVLAANQAVYARGKGVGTDMGSTLVLAVVDGTTAYIAHVGDSRIYRLNRDGIEQLTTDHSLVERLVATGQITREQARFHEQKNVIYRTVGDKPNLEIDQAVHTLKPGDYLLLCSDGLTGMVEDQWLQKIIIGAESPQAACEGLIAAANQAGGEDNITAVLVKLFEVKK